MSSRKVEVPATVAVLAALRSPSTAPEVAAVAGMSAKAVAATIARLRKKALVRRTNPKTRKPKPGVKGAVAKYAITRSGSAYLRRAVAKLGL